jgi:hypothetical protein
MEHSTTDATVFLFVVALPLSLFSWTVIVVGAGLLRDPHVQPVWLRLYMRVVPDLVSEGRTVICFGLFCLALSNFVPLGILAGGSYGEQILRVDLAYLIVQGIFLVPLGRALLRARVRDRDS